MVVAGNGRTSCSSRMWGCAMAPGPETLTRRQLRAGARAPSISSPGASGAGKTSLLKLLYLAQRPSRGIIRLFGEDAVTLPRDRLPGFRRRIGVVFQDFRLVPHLSVADNIALPLRVAGVAERDIAEPVRRDARLGRPGRTRRRAARDAVGRRAAARGDRARGDRAARDAGRGRADRQRRSRRWRSGCCTCSTR